MIIADDLTEPIQKAIDIKDLLTQEQAKALSERSENMVYGTLGTFSIYEPVEDIMGRMINKYE